MLDTVKQEKYIHSNSFWSSDNEIIMRFVQTYTRMGDILTEVFPTKSTSGDAKREGEKRERAKMPTTAAILDRLHIIDRLRYPHYEQENIFQLLQKKTTPHTQGYRQENAKRENEREENLFLSFSLTFLSLSLLFWYS